MEECSLDLIFFIYTGSFLVGVGGGGVAIFPIDESRFS